MNLLNNPELLDRLAAAYALGTLRGGARRRFESMARQSPTIRAAALVWQERFAAMTELQGQETPSPNVWKRIENLLDAPAARSVRPPADTAPAAADRWRRSLGWWRGAALAGMAATVAAVAVGLNLREEVATSQQQLAAASNRGEQLARDNAQLQAQLQAQPLIEYVAVLEHEQGAASILVTFDPKHNRLTLKRAGDFQEAADRSLQLWALPEGGGGPRSLGVLGSEPVVRLTAAENLVREVPALAISLEPKGGVPEGSGPTGPVLFKGALHQTPI